MTATESGDFDFNDVVFDFVKYDSQTNQTTLKLVALGGTLPLTVGGVDVHELYGDTTPDANGKLKMFNTGAGNTHDPVVFQVDGKFVEPSQVANLEILVKKGDSWVPLTANRGKAACKILVDSSFPIIKERQGIASENENFTKYVAGDFVNDFWWQRK